MNQFTPGPWVNDVFSVRQCDKHGLEICHTGIVGRNKEPRQAEADAKLIASAPDLLEALLDAVRLIEHLGADAGFQKRAIAKATGDSPDLLVANKAEMTGRELEFLEIVARQRDTMDKLIKRVERLESKSVMTEVIGFQ
jgi:hypothetical protein